MLKWNLPDPRFDRELHAYRVVGGAVPAGSVSVQGNKNAALPMIAASLLASSADVVVENVPEILDVAVMLELVQMLGADVAKVGEGRWRIRADGPLASDPDPVLSGRIRASFLLAAPLLVRTGRAVMPRPGGDRIGRRPLDVHLEAFRELGVKVEALPDRYVLEVEERGIRGGEVFLSEASVTATENVLVLASGFDVETVILNAASEPHVQDLCRMLKDMGVAIEGVGTNTLVVRGKSGLGGGSFRVGPDYVEVGSFIGLAAACGGEVLITGAGPAWTRRAMRSTFGRLGVVWEDRGEDVYVPPGQELVVGSVVGGVVKIDDGPWPAFPADLVSIALVVATQASGTVLVHEKMFESRLFWVDRLISMGANVILCDPHRAVVVGPSRLTGQVMASPDIRAGMALLIAAFCARGESLIMNVQQIERGYQRLPERLRGLGLSVERVDLAGHRP